MVGYETKGLFVVAAADLCSFDGIDEHKPLPRGAVDENWRGTRHSVPLDSSHGTCVVGRSSMSCGAHPLIFFCSHPIQCLRSAGT